MPLDCTAHIAEKLTLDVTVSGLGLCDKSIFYSFQFYIVAVLYPAPNTFHPDPGRVDIIEADPSKMIGIW